MGVCFQLALMSSSFIGRVILFKGTMKGISKFYLTIEVGVGHVSDTVRQVPARTEVGCRTDKLKSCGSNREGNDA